MVSLPRKKIATYGKTVRRRIPEQSFARFRQSNSPEKKPAPILSRSPSVAPSEPRRLKSPKKRPSPSSALAVKANVFDVPSSDDESVTPIASKARKPAPKATTNSNGQRDTSSKVVSSAEEMRGMKRVKLSPKVVEVEKTKTAKVSSKTYSPPVRVLHKSIELGETKVMASRPKKSSVVKRRPEKIQTPRKLSLSPKDDTLCMHPLHNDIDAMDVDTPNIHVSPRGQEIWKEVMNTVDSNVTGSTALKSTVSTRPEQISVLSVHRC